jgi:hypothetical protein
MVEGESARQDGGMGRQGQWRGGNDMLENRSLLSQPVDVGSANLCVSIGFQMIRSQGVDRDENDVPGLGILGPKKYRTREKANK